MPLGDFVPAGSTPRPMAIGRLLRIAFGVGTSYYFVFALLSHEDFTGDSIPDAGHLIGIGAAWWYLSDAVVVGFGRSWGRWPQIVVAAIAAILLLLDLVAYGGVWAAPLGWGALLLTLGMFGFFGISFLLAGILGVPG